MNHAAWNGLTATDLVFPTFVFVMGISVVFAIEARLARGMARWELIRHAAQRAVILCLLGIIVNSFPRFELDHIRFYGVLQRIAVCYLAVSLLYLATPRARTDRGGASHRARRLLGARAMGARPAPAFPAVMCRSWTSARISCPGSIASCSRITSIASRRTITCAIRKAC